jgi:glutamyl-tRNA synthetase
MSKRDQGASIEEYIEQGYLPEALRNFLCLLGWSPKDNREILAIEEIIEKFDLPQIHRHNARFDREKCFWINGEYMRHTPLEKLGTWARGILDEHGIDYRPFPEAYFLAALATVREKIKTGKDLPQWMAFYFSELFPWDENGREMLSTVEAQEALGEVYGALCLLEDWTHDGLEKAVKVVAEQGQRKIGNVVHPLRMAISGRRVGPSLYAMMEVLGKERVLERLKRAMR